MDPLHCRTITAIMASPRKFSEKIALHNQKQAEETAAFEEIMREVGSATRGAYQIEKQCHLHINQSLGSYRGGSLPNVNQIGNNSIDLQSALTSLDDMKQGRDILGDRAYRESRSRNIGPHRRQFDKRIDCSPYGSPYLSPPPDTSWRRTNSDSALHQSAMNPTDSYHGSTTPPANRRIYNNFNVVHEDGMIISDGNQLKGYWDPKKQLLPPQHSRPKSCEVPGINIYPTEQDPNIVHISIANNTGSLPDLTNIQFQSPLSTPLDTEDQTGSNYSTGMTTDSGGMAMDPYVQSHQQTNQYNLYQQSPQQQQQQQPQQQQQSLGVANTSDVATSHMSYRSNSPAETSYSAPQSPVSQTLSPVSSPGLGPPSKDPFTDTGIYYLQSNAQTNSLQEHFQQFNINMIDTPPTSVGNIFLSDVNNLQYSQVQNVGSIDGRDILDGGGYYSALDQYSHGGHSTAMSSPGAGQNHPTTPQTPQTPSSIPNIILTDFSSGPGNDDPMGRHDFVKDIGSAMAGMSGSFDSDIFVTDDLKAGLDPIDFDGLQMLTDPDIVTDPATEDSFRLDRL